MTQKPLYKATFILKDSSSVTVDAAEGENLLDVAHRHHIDLEGACEGALACSTCHLVVDPKWFAKLDEATDAEEDMLDYAFGLTSTSRLGCQIVMCAALDGIEVTLPQATRNMQVDKK